MCGSAHRWQARGCLATQTFGGEYLGHRSTFRPMSAYTGQIPTTVAELGGGFIDFGRDRRLWRGFGLFYQCWRDVGRSRTAPAESGQSSPDGAQVWPLDVPERRRRAHGSSTPGPSRFAAGGGGVRRPRGHRRCGVRSRLAMLNPLPASLLRLPLATHHKARVLW